MQDESCAEPCAEPDDHVQEADLDLFERTRRVAERRRMSLSRQIAEALERYLQAQE
jgi:hypothetical protein